MTIVVTHLTTTIDWTRSFGIVEEHYECLSSISSEWARVDRNNNSPGVNVKIEQKRTTVLPLCHLGG